MRPGSLCDSAIIPAEIDQPQYWFEQYGGHRKAGVRPVYFNTRTDKTQSALFQTHPWRGGIWRLMRHITKVWGSIRL